jgi:purine-nucleoside phosphorylase
LITAQPSNHFNFPMSTPLPFSANDPAAIANVAAQAAERIHKLWPETPRFGIVLGTGAGQLARAIQTEATIPYRDLPGFPTSTATGHASQFVCGKLQNQPVIAMEGRFHLYEGYSPVQSTVGLQTMAKLGIKFLLVSNAAGGVNPDFHSGELMLITNHIDLMFRPAPAPECFADGLRPVCRSDSAYDPVLIAQAEACARKNDFKLHRGIYCGMLGPNFETRSEYRFLRRIGCDVVGMSTIPEVRLAMRLGLRVLAFSIVTNVANPDQLEKTSGHEVIKWAEIAGPNLRQLVENAVHCNS